MRTLKSIALAATAAALFTLPCRAQDAAADTSVIGNYEFSFTPSNGETVAGHLIAAAIPTLRVE